MIAFDKDIADFKDICIINNNITCRQTVSSLHMFLDSNETRGCLSVVSILCSRHGFLRRKTAKLNNAETNNVINKTMPQEIQDCIYGYISNITILTR